MTAEEIYQAAMSLPDDSKAALAERLVADLETRVEPEVERTHLEAAERAVVRVASARGWPIHTHVREGFWTERERSNAGETRRVGPTWD